MHKCTMYNFLYVQFSSSSTQAEKLVPDIPLVSMIVIGSRSRQKQVQSCGMMFIAVPDGCCYGDQNTWNTFPGSEQK
jgi:hypothetical protein